MGMEFYGDDFRGADVAPFVGINTFLHLPRIQSHKALLEVKTDVAIIGEPFNYVIHQITYPLERAEKHHGQ